MNIIIERLTSPAPDAVYSELSALDRLCVGAEGWSPESFKSEVEKPNGIVLCALDGGKLAGLLSGYTAVGEADITSVAVSPEYRRRGIARALVEKFLALLPAGTEGVFLEVRASNAPAIALYEQCGFERLSVRCGFYSSPREDAVVMVMWGKPF